MRLRFKSPIALRLTLSFTALLALLIVLAGMTLFRVQEVSTALDRLSADQLENLDLVAEIGENSEDAARKLLVLISASRPERVLAYTEVDAANRRLDSAIALLSARLPEGDRRAPFLAVEARLRSYRTAYDRNVELIESQDWAAARRMLVEHTEIALGELTSARENLARSERQSTTSETAILKSRLATDRSIVIGLCLFGLLVGALVGVQVVRRIVLPLQRAEAAALRLSAGDYDTRVVSITNDEVGRVSLALNNLALAIGDRESALERLAHTDSLTGLAQRSRFVSRGDLLMRSLQPGDGLALLCMDIDRLKLINRVLGFDAGDAAIVDAARRIEGLAGAEGAVARLAGGTFAMIVTTRAARTTAQWIARLQEEVQRQVTWDRQSLDLSLTVGVAQWPEHALDCENLLRCAEQAMFEAKRQRTPTAMYVASDEVTRSSHLTLLSELSAAIVTGQLHMFVQPKISPVDLRPRGVEALVRWHHPERGWISPADFIPFAESSGRIRQITQWMLQQAIDTLADWQRAGIELCIAVNVSTVDLQDKHLPGRVEDMLQRANVAPRWLQLELTETGLMESGTDPIAVLHALRDIGVQLAIDDFGTGQSSLGYLQRLPVNELKIDRSFVDGFDSDPRRQQLLSSVVSLGHSLGLVVTAEGAETPAELSALRALGCDLVQGFLIAKPMPVPRFMAWREEWEQHRSAVPEAETGGRSSRVTA